MVGDDYEGPLYLWPEYEQVTGNVSEEELRHIRKRYAALLIMTDAHMGRIFDVMDKYNMWDDTAFFYTTDHGYMMGEHDFMAKNYMPAYNELFHIPLVVHLPGDAHAGERINALTQNTDILPTITELHGVKRPAEAHPLHGMSLIGLVEGRETPRECVLYGYFGKPMNLCDGRYTYFRAPRGDNRPLYMYTAVPIDNKVYFNRKRVKDISKIEMGRFLSWTDYPMYRIPAEQINNPVGYTICFNNLRPWEKVDFLFDLASDYAQEHNIINDDPETVLRLSRLMAKELVRLQAPLDHLARLGL